MGEYGQYIIFAYMELSQGSGFFSIISIWIWKGDKSIYTRPIKQQNKLRINRRAPERGDRGNWLSLMPL